MKGPGQVSETSGAASDLPSFRAGQRGGWARHGPPCTLRVNERNRGTDSAGLSTELQTTVEQRVLRGSHGHSPSASVPGLSAVPGRVHCLQQVGADASDETEPCTMQPRSPQCSLHTGFAAAAGSTVTLEQSPPCPPDRTNDMREAAKEKAPGSPLSSSL